MKTNNSPASKINLNLSENNYWDTVNAALQTLFARINEKKSIQSLTLDKINFRRADRVKSLMDLLEGNDSITSLSLASGSTLACLDDHGMKTLANTLLANQKLTSLDLSNCIVSDKIVEELAKKFTQNKTLKSLVLTGCQISQKGKIQLKQALTNNASLQVHGLN